MKQKVRKEANLSKLYTNNFIRATCISVIEKLNASRLNESKKRDIFTAVSSKVMSVTRVTLDMENTSANFEQLDLSMTGFDECLEEPDMNTKPRPENFFTNCNVTN